MGFLDKLTNTLSEHKEEKNIEMNNNCSKYIHQFNIALEEFKRLTPANEYSKRSDGDNWYQQNKETILDADNLKLRKYHKAANYDLLSKLTSELINAGSNYTNIINRHNESVTASRMDKGYNDKITQELNLAIQKNYVQKFWIGCQ